MPSFKPTKGHIAAGHPLTAEAGAIALEAGGNAFDAVIAAGMASFFVESALTSACGGGFALAAPSGAPAVLFDFFTQTPLTAPKQIRDPDFYPITIDFGDGTQDFYVGRGSEAVPGNIAGLFDLHRTLGSLPMQTLVEPVCEWARKGILIDDFLAFILRLTGEIAIQEKKGQELFCSEGRLRTTGEMVRNIELADFLEVLAREGSELFYRGEVGARIGESSVDSGGFLTRADFERYAVIQREPLRLPFRQYEVLTNPAPSIGGPLMAGMLEILESGNMRGGPWSRHDTDAIIHAQYEIDQSRKRERNPGNTTHISVMDELGNAASMTTSLGQGSTWYVPGTGMMMNNMLGESDLLPQGFHSWTPNTRVSSNMAPTVVMEEDRIRAAYGTGGANRIRTALLNVTACLLAKEWPVAQSIQSPRLHVEGNEIHAEPGLDDDGILLAADRLGLQAKLWTGPNMFFGGVHAVARSKNHYLAFGDPRRHGAVRSV